MSTLLSVASTPRLFVLALILLFSHVPPQLCDMADNTAELSRKFSHNLGEFSMDMYSKLLEHNADKNIIFSPLSIQTCVAMARIGAEGETASELDRGLRLVSSDVNTIAESFSSFLADAEKSNVLKIANKLYVMKGYNIKQEFNEIITKRFYSAIDAIDFAENVAAAKNMNGWVESKTNNLIKDLISPDAVNADTRLVLINAIHFKGQWEHKFPERNTRQEHFYLDESNSVQVPMMSLKERFRYADLTELNAAALELPYKDSDLSMLVILPNSRTGLKNLEEKLQTVSISDISKKMHSTQVIVKLPKFKAEFSVNLNDQLQKMGMSRMFSGKAEFGKMLDSDESLAVSKVIHKAFIEVNEEGTEAAAATGMLMMRCSMPMFVEPPKEFVADRPFYYVIKTGQDNILFAGNIRRLKA